MKKDFENHEAGSGDQSGPPRTALSAHTPGPWRIETSPVRKTPCVFGGPQFNTWICGEIQSNNVTRIDTAECIANARLIAAAPEMLAALRNVQKLIAEAAMTGFNCHDGDWAERLFASQHDTSTAIAKATGAST